MYFVRRVSTVANTRAAVRRNALEMPLFFLSTRYNITVNYKKDRQVERERDKFLFEDLA